MPDHPRRDLDDLDHALFDGTPGGPGTPTPPHAEPADLDAALFGSGETVATSSHGAGVGYAPPPLSRTRRVLVGLAVVTLVALGVSATVAFASGSGNSPTRRVQVTDRANLTSTSSVLRTPESLPVASIPGVTDPKAGGTTVTTQRRQTPPSTEGATEDPPPTEATEPPTAPPPTKPPTTAPTTTPTTSVPSTTSAPTTTTKPK